MENALWLKGVYTFGKEQAEQRVGVYFIRKFSNVILTVKPCYDELYIDAELREFEIREQFNVQSI